MRIHATINERTVRRPLTKHLKAKNGLTVIDRDLSAFRLKVSRNGIRTLIVRVVSKLGARNLVLGTVDKITAAEAREKAVAAIEDARAERGTGLLFADFAWEFMRRQTRRWKPATRKKATRRCCGAISCRSSATGASPRSSVPMCGAGSTP